MTRQNLDLTIQDVYFMWLLVSGSVEALEEIEDPSPQDIQITHAARKFHAWLANILQGAGVNTDVELFVDELEEETEGN